MKKSRFRTLFIGLLAGIAYAFLCLIVISHFHQNVSISFIFILPIILGAIPVFFASKEQLKSYLQFIIYPWLITFTFFALAILFGYEGLICLAMIICPFLILGTLGSFVFRLVQLKREGKHTNLYSILFIPFLFLFVESNIEPPTKFHTVETTVIINSTRSSVWENIKNVKNIKSSEIPRHFIHFIGIPKPLNGEINKEGIDGIRKITWEKGIKFEEKITSWEEGFGFEYDINVDPESIPPHTLDEHVMIGGKYFDVVRGGYKIKTLDTTTQQLTLSCTYRISTTFNAYSKLCANLVLDDFHNMILSVIKNRSE